MNNKIKTKSIVLDEQENTVAESAAQQPAEEVSDVVTPGKNEMDMTSGNLAKKILKFSLPIILSGELQLLYNAADLIVCGLFGSEHSVGAISATNALTNLIINLFMGLSVGANVLMARCVGSKKREKGQRVVYTTMILSVVMGIAVGIFGAVFSKYFLQWMGTPEDIIDLSTTYLTIYFIGVPFSMIYNFGAAILRAVGDTKRPFYFLASAGLFNVGFNFFFVLVCGMDVDGVALGTILSQAISAGCIVVYLLKYKGFFHFNLKEMRFYKAESQQIIQIGLPAGIHGVLFSVSNVIIQSSINGLGTLSVDGSGASSSIEGFVYTMMNSVAQACTAFTSANYGAKNYVNIKKSILYCTAYVCLFGIVTGVLATVFGRELLRIYLPTNPEAVEVGYSRLWLVCLTYFTCGLMDTFAYALRGIGYSVLPTAVTLAGVCGSRLLWIFVVFPSEQFHTLQGLMFSYPISWVITSTINLILLIILFDKLKKQNEQEERYATEK